jgi:hypothetical protein
LEVGKFRTIHRKAIWHVMCSRPTLARQRNLDAELCLHQRSIPLKVALSGVVGCPSEETGVVVVVIGDGLGARGPAVIILNGSHWMVAHACSPAANTASLASKAYFD